MAVGNNIRLYRGKSMEGTLRFGDRLYIKPAPWRVLRPGDVVVYRELNSRGVDNALVHRVIGVQVDGLIVKGDKNPCPDTTLVTEDNLLGLVSYVERDGKQLPLGGNRLGPLRARIYLGWRRIRRTMWRLLCLIGHGPYDRFRASGLIGHLWRPSIMKVRVMAEQGPVFKYVSRNRTVAYYWPQNGRFECRKPYDLVMWDRVKR
jgi:hypothetical protein